jgi:hypothetical protein
MSQYRNDKLFGYLLFPDQNRDGTKRVKFWPSKPALEIWHRTSPNAVNSGGSFTDIDLDEINALSMRCQTRSQRGGTGRLRMNSSDNILPLQTLLCCGCVSIQQNHCYKLGT